MTAGKQWKAKSAPNKNPSLRTTFSKRISKDKHLEATKALERQLNQERELAETVASVDKQKIDLQERKEAAKARKAAKEEKERYELMKAKVLFTH